ncbi:glycine cleavage system aminomethyltransferase GcvT [Corynebacterium sp.]|uniref:glycine cleavage system aminomethyltransferase GcvT n=1 Tax=Corynebacterium sp. TaxID=1720 RepID=UPI0026DA9901|nr:glycine cleavage system aminomethyltransferase GcvT [Corynebacterium sp.]MDO4609649.1 glycine cleavage system aminomethyltransferase GcvT [Corynebacterium sp.]
MTETTGTAAAGGDDHALLRSPLHDVHERLGARFTEFGGWEMPLRYGRELEEHAAVRTDAGLFDLSHMGEVRVTGPGAAAFLDHALISRLSAIAVGKAKYSMICAPDGGVIDDLITYRLGEEEFLVVPNAANAPVVVAELRERAEGFDVELADETRDTALIAVQGPRAEDIVAAAADDADADAIRGVAYYACVPATVVGVAVLVARTGYTGEDGFELFCPAEVAPAVWDAVAAAAETEAGGGRPATPCGLACRDTLRLEAGMPLYGQELTRDLTPVDVGLGVLAATKSKEEFVGRDAIVAAKENGPARALIGLAGEGRRAAREGYAVHAADAAADAAPIGAITSGVLSPTLGHPIALASVDAATVAEGGPAAPGSVVEVDVRGKRLTFRVVETPFYRRSR